MNYQPTIKRPIIINPTPIIMPKFATDQIKVHSKIHPSTQILKNHALNQRLSKIKQLKMKPLNNQSLFINSKPKKYIYIYIIKTYIANYISRTPSA